MPIRIAIIEDDRDMRIAFEEAVRFERTASRSS
jgi:hypothetical protein